MPPLRDLRQIHLRMTHPIRMHIELIRKFGSVAIAVGAASHAARMTDRRAKITERDVASATRSHIGELRLSFRQLSRVCIIPKVARALHRVD